MNELWLHGLPNHSGLCNRRLTIMLMAFIGTHVPLIALARSPRLNLLAEGANMENEVRSLKRRGCDLFQSYFSRPITSLDLAAGVGRLPLSAMAMTSRMDRGAGGTLSVA